MASERCQRFHVNVSNTFVSTNLANLSGLEITSSQLSRILVRAVSYTIHGLIPASCVFADRYNREEVVASLGREINLNPPLTLGQLPDTSEELLKLDQVCLMSLYMCCVMLGGG